jgi:hypothetical protein
MRSTSWWIVLIGVAIIALCGSMWRIETFKVKSDDNQKPQLKPNTSSASVSESAKNKSTPTGIIGGGLGNATVTPMGIILPGQNSPIPVMQKVCGTDLQCNYKLADGRIVTIEGTTIIGIQNPFSSGSTPSPAPAPSPTPSSSKITTGPFSATPSTVTCPNGEASTTGCCPKGEPKGEYPCCPDGSRSRKGKCS